jgi:hypothetical protein
MNGPRTPSIDCRACRHFWITWQSRFPYGCRAFQMVCQSMPSAHVRQQSGEDCLYHEPKPQKKQKKDGEGGSTPPKRDGWLV